MVTASSPGSLTVTRNQSPSVLGKTVKGTSPPGVRMLAVPIESLGSKASRLAVKSRLRREGLDRAGVVVAVGELEVVAAGAGGVEGAEEIAAGTRGKGPVLGLVAVAVEDAEGEIEVLGRRLDREGELAGLDDVEREEVVVARREDRHRVLALGVHRHGLGHACRWARRGRGFWRSAW